MYRPPLRPVALVLAAATLAGAATLAARTVVSAQVGTRDAKPHVFYPYGLDATRVRVDDVARVAHIDRRPYVREQDPGDGSTGYLLVTLTVSNTRRSVENIPLFATSVTMAGGRTIDPAVYGPFIGTATVPAPASATVGSHKRVTLRLAVADVPNAEDVVALVFNPNDATPQYRFRLQPANIAALPDVPRGAR